MEARASTEKDISALEVRVRSTKAHVMDVAAVGEKRLPDFEKELIKDLVDIYMLYELNVQSIGRLCSPMPGVEPKVTNYILWLIAEVTSLPVFAGVNKNFVPAMVECTLMMAGGSVDLVALQASATDSREDILPSERDVWRTAHVIS
jgi:hypothetical protein